MGGKWIFAGWISWVWKQFLSFSHIAKHSTCVQLWISTKLAILNQWTGKVPKVHLQICLALRMHFSHRDNVINKGWFPSQPTKFNLFNFNKYLLNIYQEPNVGSDIARWYWEKSDAILGLKKFTCQLKKQTHHWPRSIHSFIHRINRFTEHLLCALDTVLSCSHGAFSLVRGKKNRKAKSLSRVRLFVNPWTLACQAPPSMGFSRQEYWSGLAFPCPGDLLDPGIKPRSPTLQADSLPSEPPGKPSER